MDDVVFPDLPTTVASMVLLVEGMTYASQYPKRAFWPGKNIIVQDFPLSQPGYYDL